MTDQTERLAALEKRLHDGFLRIGEAMNAGTDVPDWEALWVKLLREYETMSDDVAAIQAAAPPTQAAMDLGVRAERDAA